MKKRQKAKGKRQNYKLKFSVESKISPLTANKCKTSALLVLLFTSYFLLFTLARFVEATNVSSNNYEIKMGNLNMGAGLPSSDDYKLGVTGGQTAPGLYTSDGYYVKAGFWYIMSKIPFAFTISDLTIDFGTLTAGSPTTSQNKLSVSAGGAGGYQVTAIENGTLQTQGGTASIPDTSCNGGDDTCNETTAAPWTDNTKDGFGYNMSGHDIPSTFAGSTYYRPFPSQEADEDPAIVMERNYVGRDRVATVTYKVNILGSQEAGDYRNYIIFIATPKY